MCVSDTCLFVLFPVCVLVFFSTPTYPGRMEEKKRRMITRHHSHPTLPVFVTGVWSSLWPHPPPLLDRPFPLPPCLSLPLPDPLPLPPPPTFKQLRLSLWLLWALFFATARGARGPLSVVVCAACLPCLPPRLPPTQSRARGGVLVSLRLLLQPFCSVNSHCLVMTIWINLNATVWVQCLWFFMFFLLMVQTAWFPDLLLLTVFPKKAKKNCHEKPT